jgi:hypothetical protein
MVSFTKYLKFWKFLEIFENLKILEFFENVGYQVISEQD